MRRPVWAARLAAIGCVGAALIAACGFAATALAQTTPGVGAPVIIDGGPGIAAPVALGTSIARDGTGGVVYLKQVAGVEHVFVSRLLGGIFQPPQQLDEGLAGASSQPVIAAGNAGTLLVGYVNSGQLYVVVRPNAFSGYTSPAPLAAGASNPSLEMTNFGKAYLAFVVPDGAGHDVRAAYYYQGRWSVESSPLNNIPGDDAGTGTGRPAMGAAGDGVGIVAWGEGGHVFTRRVWGTSPSIVLEQADGPLPGCSELSADEPGIGVEGDSSYADVAFHERLSCGGQPQSRVLMNRLHGSVYDGITQPDGGGSAASEGADDPQIAMGEYGRGWVTSAHTTTNNVFATQLGDNGWSYGVFQVNGTANATAPHQTAAVAGLFSDVIAWQHDAGTAGAPDIRARFAPDGATFGGELVLSSANNGPTDAANGLNSAGDSAGDAAVVWAQGTPAAEQIVATLLYQPPGGFVPVRAFSYARTSRPVIAWSPSRENWGLRYLVTVDGIQIAQTTATQLTVPGPLADGLHTWQVTAVNGAGMSRPDEVARVFVDTVRPVGKMRLVGTKRAGSRLQLRVSYTDTPPPVPAAASSGIAEVLVKWGDRHTSRIAHRKYHVYTRPGLYRITVVIVDRAGNTTKLIRWVRIKPPKKAPSGHKRGGSTTGGAPTGH